MKFYCSILAFFVMAFQAANAQTNISASEALIKRVAGAHSSNIKTEFINAQNDKDVFEIESKNNKIILRGNTGVAIASALYYYLNEFCHAQITWNGVNLHLPKNFTKSCKQNS